MFYEFVNLLLLYPKEEGRQIDKLINRDVWENWLHNKGNDCIIEFSSVFQMNGKDGYKRMIELILIDTDNVYIKNLIMRDLYYTDGIRASTKDYIVSKCSNDANYVVRMVCKRESQKNSEEVGDLEDKKNSCENC